MNAWCVAYRVNFGTVYAFNAFSRSRDEALKTAAIHAYFLHQR